MSHIQHSKIAVKTIKTLLLILSTKVPLGRMGDN